MQVNIADAKRNLSKLIRLLETQKEDTIQIARNGKPIVRMTYINETPAAKRIGLAKGKFKAPDDFDADNEEIYEMLTKGALS